MALKDSLAEVGRLRGAKFVLAVVGVMVVLGVAASLAASAPAEPPHEAKPLVLVAAGRSSSGPWKVLVGQAASGPYMRVHHNGANSGLDADGSDGGALRSFSTIELPDEAPAMLYGVVDDDVSRVALEFVGGGSQELDIVRLADVGFFYGVVPTQRRVAKMTAYDAWNDPLAAATCSSRDGIGTHSILGNGCMSGAPQSDRPSPVG